MYIVKSKNFLKDSFVIVLDLDRTLISDDCIAYPNASRFIKNLSKLKVILGIWTAGNKVHYEKSIGENFLDVANHLDFSIAGRKSGTKSVSFLKDANIYGDYYILVDDLPDNNDGYNLFLDPQSKPFILKLNKNLQFNLSSDEQIPNYDFLFKKIQNFIKQKRQNQPCNKNNSRKRLMSNSNKFDNNKTHHKPIRRHRLVSCNAGTGQGICGSKKFTFGSNKKKNKNADEEDEEDEKDDTENGYTDDDPNNNEKDDDDNEEDDNNNNNNNDDDSRNNNNNSSRNNNNRVKILFQKLFIMLHISQLEIQVSKLYNNSLKHTKKFYN